MAPLSAALLAACAGNGAGLDANGQPPGSASVCLPFGLRLQDQSAFVRQVTGINMATPDQGVEFGWLKGHWDAQLAASNGTAGGAGTSNGKQSSAQRPGETLTL